MQFIDPGFVSKLRSDREDEIDFSVAGRFDKMGLSRVLIDFWKMSIASSFKGIELLIIIDCRRSIFFVSCHTKN